MDHFRFRGAVKIISYIDMTFSLVIIVLTVLATIGVFLATVVTEHHELRLFFLQGNTKRLQDVGRTFTTIWILSFTFNILQFFAGCALLSGTDLVEDEEEEDNKSIQKCRLWQCTSIFLFAFIALLVWFHPTPYLLGFGLGELIFRVVGIYFVGRYVSELEEENNINSSSSQLYYFDDIDDNFPPR
ncbi:uncharacterized protein LOC110852179 isoform X2 [Folsomia candida]|uniref:uncharacterized protein LOC110852179 isoform X2 n=1 Tax=Folsomia candida TaxID=158441 RepID=UPI000B8F7F56|nr:uncharacterized protein LOC110852179 isoform X2 [Folsomia candida]